MSSTQRTAYLHALHEAAHHVVAAILAPDLERRAASMDPGVAGPDAPVLLRRSADSHVRVEALSLLAGPAAAALGSLAAARDFVADAEAARALLASLGEADREPIYRSEAAGYAQNHFLTIRALALQLLQAGTISAEETGLIIQVAEGQAPLRALEAYRGQQAATG